MIKFDIGDRVKVLNNLVNYESYYDEYIGKIGIVSDYDDQGNVEVDGLDGFYTRIFNENNLEFVWRRNG
ncbi:MAG: hypothetical protein PHC28_16350 [Flavobacterium sp.]|uniref:hypothetical protein n=1 Tax=Flavobacterium sp. TaxID=239 RepID=UPI002634B420|nr:hypothetical protein [Flavobacterium sp.]MDD5152025.1 hypothetical protein [Flavobacterium sp.]